MDQLKLAAQLVMAAGLAFIWPGPGIVEWVRTSDPAFQAAATTMVTWAPPSAPAGVDARAEASDWFTAVKPYCNTVEAKATIQRTPPPEDWWGNAHAAACLALGGLTEDARVRIAALSPDKQWQAAGVVFDAAHPVADGGDELAAGPMMELVVEFWPNHYMALYHAGSARYQQGDFAEARAFLESFLRHYDQEDGWTEAARGMLAEAPGT